MARVVRHQSERDRWEMVHGAPDPRLDGYVLDYCAYDERTGSFVRRRELPSDRVVAIVNLGAPIRVLTPEGWTDQPDGFLAGLHDTFALTETSGAQRGVQIDLSPVGAHLLLRLPMHELAGRVVTLEALFGRAGTAAARGARVGERVGGSLRAARRLLPGPARRRALAGAERHPRARPAARERRQRARRRRWRPRSAAAAGISSTGFREQVGVSPKLLGRILRFQRAVALSGDRARLGRDRAALRLLRPGAPDPRLQPVRGQLAGRVRPPPVARRRGRRRRLTRCSSASARRRCWTRSCAAPRTAAAGSPSIEGAAGTRQDAPAAPRDAARRGGGRARAQRLGQRARARVRLRRRSSAAGGARRAWRAPRSWRRRRSGCRPTWPRRTATRCSTGSTGWSRTSARSGRCCWRSTTRSGSTSPACASSPTSGGGWRSSRSRCWSRRVRRL